MELFEDIVLGVWVVLIFVALVFCAAESNGREVKDWILNAWYYPLLINVFATFVLIEMLIFL